MHDAVIFFESPCIDNDCHCLAWLNLACLGSEMKVSCQSLTRHMIRLRKNKVGLYKTRRNTCGARRRVPFPGVCNRQQLASSMTSLDTVQWAVKG